MSSERPSQKPVQRDNTAPVSSPETPPNPQERLRVPEETGENPAPSNNDVQIQGISAIEEHTTTNEGENMQTLIPQVLELKRGDLRNSSGQIGSLYHKGRLLCHILEDPSRDVKIYGETAIPAGEYDIVVQKSRGRAFKHGARWPWHESEIMELVNVPGFEYIQIHPGNYPKDTLGCLLPGKWNGRSMMVSQSVVSYKILYDRFVEHARQGLLKIIITEE